MGPGRTGVLGENPLPEPDQRDRLRPGPAPEQALGRDVGHRLRRVGHVDVHVACGVVRTRFSRYDSENISKDHSETLQRRHKS